LRRGGFEIGRGRRVRLTARGVFRPAGDGGTYVELDIGARPYEFAYLLVLNVALLLIATAAAVFAHVSFVFTFATVFVLATAGYVVMWRNRAAAHELLLFVKQTLDASTATRTPT
jgi:hypothetical protein